VDGKGVFIKIIEALVGLENTSHVPLQDLSDKFGAADLHGKLVNTFADLNSLPLTSTSMFKTLTSGDSIRAQKKYGQPFNFRNRAKLIFSANKVPETSDKSFAFYRRLVILSFDKVFEGHSQDPDLTEKLITEDELSGLLNLALVGLKKLQKDRGFKNVSVERVKEDYDNRADTIRAFLDQNHVIDLTAPEYLIPTAEVYSAYSAFCFERKERPLEPNILGKRLAEYGIEKKPSRYAGDRDYYLGIVSRDKLAGPNQLLNQ
jgi:putative DNA primase/helicase